MRAQSRVLVFSVLFLLCACLLLEAQPPAPSSVPPPIAAAPAQTPPPQAAPPAEPAKRDVQDYRLTGEKYEKAIAYSRAQYVLYFVNAVYGFLMLIVILALRLAPKFRDWAEAASRRRFVQVIIFAPLLNLLVAVFGIPLDVAGQWLSRKYDQSVQGWGSWAWDWAKGQMIATILGTLLIWLLYGVVRRSPRRWWFYFWLATIPIIILLLFLSPVVIQPLFFKFEPLEAKQPALVTEIEKVTKRGGLEIPRARMFEMKASEKLKSVNAYVTGFGASKRVVVWDTTLAQMSSGQTLFVFGHEMGHYVLGHIPRSIAFTAVVLLIFLYAGYRGLHTLLARWGERWAIRGADDWASLPILLLLMSLMSFVFSPVFSTYSRYQEHEADIYGLEVVHGIVPESAQAAAEAFQILGEINLADPEPNAFIKIWLYGHPPVSERVVFARRYDPWTKGEAPKFVK